MSAVFTAMLGPLYDKLGSVVPYVPAGDQVPADKRVIFDTVGVDVLDGLATQEPSLRVIAADFPDGIGRGARFEMAADVWHTVRRVDPIAPDGAELRVALAREA